MIISMVEVGTTESMPEKISTAITRLPAIWLHIQKNLFPLLINAHYLLIRSVPRLEDHRIGDMLPDPVLFFRPKKKIVIGKIL